MSELITIKYYPVDSDVKPYFAWFDKLDTNAQAMIFQRFERVRQGLFGDHHPLKNCNGLWELKFKAAGGLRIYFGRQGNLVIILWGGSKATQNRDIEKAQEYWLHHTMRIGHEKRESYRRI